MIWEGGRTEEWEVLEVKADPVDGGGSSLSIASARFLIAKISTWTVYSGCQSLTRRISCSTATTHATLLGMKDEGGFQGEG